MEGLLLFNSFKEHWAAFRQMAKLLADQFDPFQIRFRAFVGSMWSDVHCRASVAPLVTSDHFGASNKGLMSEI